MDSVPATAVAMLEVGELEEASVVVLAAGAKEAVVSEAEAEVVVARGVAVAGWKRKRLARACWLLSFCFFWNWKT